MKLQHRLVPGLALLACVLVASQTFAQQQPGGNSIAVETTVTALPSGKWTGARLRDGQPDIQGFWSNTIGNHSNFTDPQGGVPGDPNPRARAKGPREERAPSRVSDPPDGEVPFQPWASAKQQEFLAHFHNPTRPEYVEPLARCAPAGVPKSFMWHGFEIRQYPQYVLMMFDSGWRIIHFDGKPHLPATIKLWNADSRGRWEGNTLIVDVTNNNAKARLGRTGEFFSDNVHIEERYIFASGGQRFNYVATITDQTVFTRPWTTTIPVRRYTEKDTPDGWHYEVTAANTANGELVHEHSERICIENNGPFGQVSVGPAKK
jgi:hypothetical protein